VLYYVLQNEDHTHTGRQWVRVCVCVCVCVCVMLIIICIVPLLPGVLSFSELSFITEPSDITVLPKDPALLDCLAHGQPPVTVKWLKDGAAVAESEHARILQNGSLHLPSVRRDTAHSDEGLYQCLSQNKYGAILSQRSRLTIASEYGGHSGGLGYWVGRGAPWFSEKELGWGCFWESHRPDRTVVCIVLMWVSRYLSSRKCVSSPNASVTF